MTIEEIKRAVDDGLIVHVCNENYQVIKDGIGQYLIHSKCNDNYIGLHGRGVYEGQLNYPAENFYVKR